LKYRAAVEALAVCRIAPGAEIPHWARDGSFTCVVRTPEEVSVVCAENIIPSQCPGVICERGWRALKLEGPFAFAMTGVLASFIQPLAEAEVPIFAISTFDTDYVLIKTETLETALAALTAAGHENVDAHNLT